MMLNRTDLCKGTAPSNFKEIMASTVPACMGGPVPVDGDYAVFRWLGNCCWEIAYRGQIVLLDNYYDRGPRAPESGIRAADIKKADAIVLSHGHGDHIGDTIQVAKATGAQVYGHQTIFDILLPLGLPQDQFHIFEDPKKNEIPFDGFKITMIHTLHNARGRDSSGFRPAIHAYTAPDEAVLAEEERLAFKGAKNRSIGDIGLFSFYITFESGFSVFASESNQRGHSEAMQEFVDSLTEGVDVLLAPCQLGFDPSKDIYEKGVVSLIEDLKPGLVMPQHHDLYPNFPMSSMLPLFQWIYDNHPNEIRGYLQLYREPIVFDTVGHHGARPVYPVTNY